MRFLIIADPIEGLSPKSDTGLSMVREALSRKHTVFWATPEDFFMHEHQIFVQASKVLSCEEGELAEVSDPLEGTAITNFAGIWIRKDPPLSIEYISLCWLLALEEKNIPIINSPSALLRYHEKMIPLEAHKAGYLKEDELIPTFMATGTEIRRPHDFHNGEIIGKPWMGHGGRDIEKWKSLSDAIDSPFAPPVDYTIFQPFLSTVIEKGDRRVLFIDGDYVGDVVRIPQEGSIVANLVRGGTAILDPMTAKEEDITKRLGEFFKSIGIGLAGADYIDEKVTEVNITAPTGFEALVTLGKPNPRVPYLDYAERLAEQFQKKSP